MRHSFLLIAMISVSLEPKWRHFAQVNIADIFMLSSKLPKQNENISVYTAYSDSQELLVVGLVVVFWWRCFGASFLPSFLPANLPACFPACQLAFCSCSLMFSNAQNNLFDPTPNVYKGHLRRGPALPSSCQDFQMI